MKKSTLQNQPALHHMKGFTLLEVLIVVLIIAVLVVSAVPQAQQSLNLYRVESSAGLLSNRLAEARLTAIKYNRSAWLEIDRSAKTFEVWTTDENNKSIRTKLAVAIPSNVAIDPGSPDRITFNSLGRNQANSNVIVKFSLAKTNFCKAVTVSAVGSIKVAAC
jgi:prepilin-type N-terminal cleavage/methylation domain-containing protein